MFDLGHRELCVVQAVNFKGMHGDIVYWNVQTVLLSQLTKQTQQVIQTL